MNDVKGTTLFEILLATFVFVLAMGALLSSIAAVLYLIDVSKDQTIAVADLRNIMEKIRVVSFADVITVFPNGVQDGPGGNSYQNMVGGYSLTEGHITITYFPDINSDPLQIKAEVTWQDKRGRAYSAFMSTFKTR